MAPSNEVALRKDEGFKTDLEREEIKRKNLLGSAETGSVLLIFIIAVYCK